jgi:hypothetical protein
LACADRAEASNHSVSLGEKNRTNIKSVGLVELLVLPVGKTASVAESRSEFQTGKAGQVTRCRYLFFQQSVKGKKKDMAELSAHPTSSAWLSELDCLPVHQLAASATAPATELPEAVDVVVVGAGLTGIFTAYWLLKLTDLRVLVLDVSVNWHALAFAVLSVARLLLCLD